MSLSVYGIGNLGKDAEVVNLQGSEAKLLTFSFAVESDTKVDNKPVTNWHDASIRVTKDPAGLQKILVKGARIFVKDGSWEITTKENSETGKKVYYHSLRIRSFDLISMPKDRQAAPEAAADAPTGPRF